MQNKKISNKIIFISLTFLTFLLYWYGKEIANFLDIKWIIKYPKHLVFPLAKYLSGFVKWLMDEANFIIFSFRDFTRFIAWLIELPYNFQLAKVVFVEDNAAHIEISTKEKGRIKLSNLVYSIMMVSLIVPLSMLQLLPIVT